MCQLNMQYIMYILGTLSNLPPFSFSLFFEEWKKFHSFVVISITLSYISTPSLISFTMIMKGKWFIWIFFMPSMMHFTYTTTKNNFWGGCYSPIKLDLEGRISNPFPSIKASPLKFKNFRGCFWRDMNHPHKSYFGSGCKQPPKRHFGGSLEAPLESDFLGWLF